MNSSTPLSLLVQLRTPNEAAWNRFVELYTPLLLQWAENSRLQPHDADELVQEVFVVLLRALPEFEHNRKQSFRAWLFTVMRNKWMDMGRKRQRFPVNDEGLSSVTSSPDIIEMEEAEFRKQLIHRALQLAEAELGDQTIAAFRATAIEGRPTTAVARELGITENAVYSARRRVMQKLREHLDGMWN